MIRILGRRTPELRFMAAALQERTENDQNPGRGWYRIYTFALEQPVEETELQAVCCKEEQLGMALIDIGHYRDCPMDEAALRHLGQILHFFRNEKKELIVRFVYDREGKGMEHEPSCMHTIEQHMKQVGPVLQHYADIIFTLQGLFVGSWGEMHGSKFLSESCLIALARTLYDTVGGSCRLAVRKPQQLRMIFPEAVLKGSQAPMVGLFNDGMLASESDLGTYGSKRKKEAGWAEAWRREDELAFQEQLCQRVPNGGEVVQDNPLNDFEHAVAEMRKMQITYLNSLYDKPVLEKWKNTACVIPGTSRKISGYDYIGAHLGYRFFIKEAHLEIRKKNPALTLRVENTGFASCYEKMEVSLLLRESGRGIKKIPIPTDVREWSNRESSRLSAELGILEGEETEVWFQIQRCKDQANIRLANVGAGEVFLLGKLVYTKTAK